MSNLHLRMIIRFNCGTEFTERHSVCRSFNGNALSEKYNVNETVYEKNT